MSTNLAQALAEVVERALRAQIGVTICLPNFLSATVIAKLNGTFDIPDLLRGVTHG